MFSSFNFSWILSSDVSASCSLADTLKNKFQLKLRRREHYHFRRHIVIELVVLTFNSWNLDLPTKSAKVVPNLND